MELGREENEKKIMVHLKDTIRKNFVNHCSFSTNSLAVLLPSEMNKMLVQIDFADSSIRGNYKDLNNSTTNDKNEKGNTASTFP